MRWQPPSAGGRMKISGRDGEIPTAKLFSRTLFRDESHDYQNDVVFQGQPAFAFFLVIRNLGNW